MNNIWFSADWHFSKWSKRKEELQYDIKKDRDILRKYASSVDKDDIFIFLGDLTEVRDDNPRLVKRCIEQIKELPGNKIFIRGNNDIESDDYYINHLGFLDCYDKLEVDNFVFTHEPVQINEGQINIHGHIHGCKTYWNCDAKNHVDTYIKLFNNYPIKIGPLLYKGNCIDKELIEDGLMVEKLKSSLFGYVNRLKGIE